MEQLYATAYLIARLAHKGQKDKSGADYFNHPLTVSSYCTTPEGKICGLLHDVMEDTDVTDKELSAIFPENIMEALRILTHPEGEDYLNYVARCKTNPIALEVKLADLKNNSDPERLALLPKETQERLIRKYDSAKKILNS